MPMPKRETPRPTPVAMKDKLVTIQQFTTSSTDNRGQPSGSWGNLSSTSSVWASIEPLNVRTTEYAHQLYAQATHRIFIDYRDDVTRHMRLKYATRIFDIGHVINLHEANVTLELLCTEADPT